MSVKVIRKLLPETDAGIFWVNQTTITNVPKKAMYNTGKNIFNINVHEDDT
ncbi:MAG: hypothetical protein RL329_3775 [Bacteroidota bacterium]